MLLALLVIGLTSYMGLIQSTDALTKLNKANVDQSILERLGRMIEVDIPNLANSANLGAISFDQATRDLEKIRVQDEKVWEDLIQAVPDSDKASLLEKKEITDQAISELGRLFAARDRNNLNLYLANDLSGVRDPIQTEILSPRRQQIEQDTNALLQRSLTFSRNSELILIVIGLVGILVATGLGALTYNSIAKPVEKIADTMQQVSAGNFSARVNLVGGDELATLGREFDRLLNERVAALVETEQANEQLNDSIIQLLQAVSQLSQRDLTVTVPVNEDITGPMADALNLLTSETAKVLANVTQLSEDVAAASNKVKAQSDAVLAVADEERQEVERAATELTTAAEDMDRIAGLAKACNQTAGEAIDTTRKALETVESTVDGITSTRDTIRETEKRIKRLGERSQEISGVVNLINTIAERTHILALNASMHAASAGEAGRGFAVVADEVQRLAENAREATSQIATLVSSIQVETADTANAMNQAIAEVVEGSRLAEQAGEQMRKTQQTTAELVASVQQIAARSQDQARVSSALLERAKQIQNSTLQTGQQLMEQGQYTESLVDFAGSLLDSVRVFKLPVESA
ncbi:MAG TPA: methyl-accepting chemotaxis protein [Candidatus Competibacter sp.]|nr:methyl-accepting chemotaxis protein [Candidatus Competibacter sp.]